MRVSIRQDFVNFSLQFSGMIQELKAAAKVGDDKDFVMAKSCWNLVVQGLKLLGNWSAAMQETLSWKYCNPCSNEQFLKMGGKKDKKYMPYQCATQYNFTNEEKWVLVEILGLIKGLSKLMV